ncbi:MAG: ABC transporter permease [Ktedonobacteraceae bacterium]
MFRSFFRVVGAIIKKDLVTWLRQPINMVAMIAPALSILLVGALGAAAGGRSPVALVQLDHSAKGVQMAQIFHQADVFRLTDVNSESQAKQLLKNLDVVAIITIPADFSQQVAQGQQAPVDVEVNNLNADFTNDIHRSVPDAITQFYQAQGPASPVKVGMHESDVRQRDVEQFQYTTLPTMAMLLMISGLIAGGLSTAREWETRTAKELLLAPVARGTIIVGKVLASFITTFGLGLFVLLLGYALGWTQPQGIYWASTVFIIALVALFSSSLGIALGALLQRMQAVIGISVNVAFYLFFLAGGIGVLAFEPDWLQTIAAYIPLTYGIHALQMAIFYSSSDQLGTDTLVLAGSALAALVLGTLSMQRNIAN